MDGVLARQTAQVLRIVAMPRVFLLVFSRKRVEGGRERGALIRITGSVMYLAYLSESGSKFSFEVDDTDAKL